MKNEKDQVSDKIDNLEASNKALDLRLDKTLEEVSFSIESDRFAGLEEFPFSNSW